MHIKMKIVEVWPNDHLVVVRYFTDKITEEILATPNPQGEIIRRPDGSPWRCRTDVSLNIWKVPAPTGQDLIDYIAQNSRPNEAWFELQEKILDPAIDTSMAAVQPMVGVVHDVKEPGPTAPASSAVQLRARRPADRQIKTTVL